MCVVLDEADKLLEGKDNNQSFAGLEHFFTLAQGSTYEVGSVKHTLSPDFYLFMTMNKPNLPDHINSRFPGGSIYVEPESIDRLKIVLAQICDNLGNSVLPPGLQKKLAFLVTTAWDSLSESAKQNKNSWDLRTLSAIISKLVSEIRTVGQSETSATGLSFTKATETIAKILGSAWGELSPLHDSVQSQSIEDLELVMSDEYVNALLQEEKEDADFLLRLTQFVPTPAYPLNGWRRVLSAAETQKLAHIVTSTVTPMQSQIITLNEGIEKGSLNLAVYNEETQPMIIKTPEDFEENLKVIGVNAWGNVALVKYLKNGQFEYSVISTIQKDSQNRDTAKVLFTGNYDSVVLSPDGKSICGCKNSKIDIYQIPQPDNSEQMKPLFSVTAPVGSNIPEFMEFTADGRFLSLKYEPTTASKNGLLQVIDVYKSTLFKAPVLIAAEDHRNWEIRSFNNQVFLLDKSQNKGYCVN